MTALAAFSIGTKPEAINFERELYRDADGFEHPITHWFGEFGEDCDPEDALTAVAGTEGRWFALDVTAFR